MVFAEAGSHEPVRRNAKLDQSRHHRQCPRLRQFPVRGEGRAGRDGNAVGMAVHAQDPVDIVRDLPHQALQRLGEPRDLRPARLGERR